MWWILESINPRASHKLWYGIFSFVLKERMNSISLSTFPSSSFCSCLRPANSCCLCVVCHLLAPLCVQILHKLHWMLEDACRNWRLWSRKPCGHKPIGGQLWWSSLPVALPVTVLSTPLLVIMWVSSRRRLGKLNAMTGATSGGTRATHKWQTKLLRYACWS